MSSTPLAAGRAFLLAAFFAIPGPATRGQDQVNDAQLRRAIERRVAIQPARPVVVADAADAAPEANDPATTGVFVRDSAVAAEKLALAERMEGLKEWDTSAEVYQEVLDQYADRVLPIHLDAQGRPDRFGSVTSVVQSRLAKWPEAGRSVYLSRYELPARRMLESASLADRTDLMKVVNRYFITSAGRDAAMLLIESYFDHAEFIAAASLADRLLDEHPQIETERPLLVTRSALSWHLAGEDARAQLRAGELKEQFADSSETIGGKPRNLLDIVTTTLAAPRVSRSATAEKGWPVPFGSNARDALSSEAVESTPRIWARLQSIRLRPGTPSPNLYGMPDGGGTQILQRQRDLGAMTGILPSVDGNQMFFQDNAAIYAYDLERGEPLLGWLATYPGEGQYKISAFASPRNVQMTTTLTDRHVLAILGQPETVNMTGSDMQTPIVCLDRANGSLNWKVSLGDLVTDDETLKSARPCGSVLVVGDSVYVSARSRRNGAFEDSYLVCFDLSDGSLRWSRHLASGNSPRLYAEYGLPTNNAGDSHLAYADGRIFASTDNGGLACVNAADGSLSWLSVYPRPVVANPQMQWQAMNMAMGGVRVKPAFAGNPVIVHEGLIICLPSDAEHLFVFDAVTGEMRGRVFMTTKPDPAFVEPTQKYSILVGVNQDHVVVAGSRSIALLDLARIEGEKELASVLVRKPAEFRRQGFEDDTIRGRPFITDSSIYVPTAWKLFRLSGDGSRALEMYPSAPQDTWDLRPDEAPGNVIFANDLLIVASPQQVNVYADLSMLRRRMEAAVSADVRSITPRLRYADALFNAGQIEEAIRWVDSAIHQLTTSTLITPGPDRDRIFEMLSGMFRRLARQGTSPQQLAGLLERLGKTADTPIQQAGYQLARAHLADRAGDAATAIDAYQTLIAEASIGAIRVRDENTTVSLREFATRAIGQVIKNGGREVYASVEARAVAALGSARAANDPVALFGVLDAYPNSQAGREAVSLATDATLAGRSPSRDLLRRIGGAVTEPAQRLQLLESILRIDLKMGNIESALGRARQMARLDRNRGLSDLPAFRDHSLTPGSAEQLVSQLQALVFAEQDGRLADLKVPDEEPIFDLPNRVETRDVAAMLIPLKPRPDRLVAVSRSDRSLLVFEPGNPKPLRTIALASVPDHAQAQWQGDTLLVTTSSRVASVDTAAGIARWTFDPQDLKPASRSQTALMSLDSQGLLDPSPATVEKSPIVLNPVAQRAQLRQQRARLRAIQVDGNEPQVGWAADEPAPRTRESIAYARFVGDAVVIATSRGRVIGLDATTGKVRWQSTFSDRAPSMVGTYDDLFVAGGNDESSSTLIAFRARDGEAVLSQTYSGPLQRRLNAIGVSPEGFLAAVHNDSIDVFDLDTDDDSPIATFDGQGQMIFADTNASEKVQFCGDKLLVLVGRAGTPQQVRMFDALSLEPVAVSDEKTNQRIERQFTPSFPDGLRPGEASARMYVHKDRLLLRGGRGFTVFAVLTRDASTWSRMLDGSRNTMNSQSPILVRDGVLIVNWPPDSLNGTSPVAGIEYYKRETLDDGREVSIVLAEFKLTRPDARMLDSVQAVNGGFYTVWTDGVLSFVPSRTK